MTSHDWTEDLTAYIDGELDPATTQAFEAQLGADPKLKALEQQLRKTVALMATMPAAEPSKSLRRSVLLEVDAPSWQERLRSFLTPGRLVPVGALAVAGAAAFVVMQTGNARDYTGPESEEQMVLAQNIDVLEDLDLVGLERADDFDVVASLHELNEGKAP